VVTSQIGHGVLLHWEALSAPPEDRMEVEPGTPVEFGWVDITQNGETARQDPPAP